MAKNIRAISVPVGNREANVYPRMYSGNHDGFVGKRVSRRNPLDPHAVAFAS